MEGGPSRSAIGPPGAGKSHLAAAIGFALVENGRRVLFSRTGELVQRLQVARRGGAEAGGRRSRTPTLDGARIKQIGTPSHWS
jgi:DNA replication protein DnaC